MEGFSSKEFSIQFFSSILLKCITSQEVNRFNDLVRSFKKQAILDQISELDTES